MPNPPSFNELAKSHQALLFDFAIAELELAITFYRISTTTSDPAKAARNADHARRARQSARKAIEEAELSCEQYQEIEPRLDRLKELSDLA